MTERESWEESEESLSYARLDEPAVMRVGMYSHVLRVGRLSAFGLYNLFFIYIYIAMINVRRIAREGFRYI